MSTRFTIGSTYYNNPKNLEEFLKIHQPYADEIIIVDDGSDDPITNYIQPLPNLRIFRVTKDYGFNSHGCRNLIMKQARNDWVILMDLDRKFLEPDIGFANIQREKLNPRVRYRFVMHVKPGMGIHPSVNDFLIHKNHFFSVGGYDEEIIGQRWGDREMFDSLKTFGIEKILYGVDLCFTRRASLLLSINSKLDKPIDVNNEKLIKLIKGRIDNPDPNKPILTFEWEEITADNLQV